jgi:hypothetical protein
MNLNRRIVYCITAVIVAVVPVVGQENAAGQPAVETPPAAVQVPQAVEQVRPAEVPAPAAKVCSFLITVSRNLPVGGFPAGVSAA